MSKIILVSAALFGLVNGDSVGTYFFGNGCFWHNQHLFTTSFEQRALGRSEETLSSTAVYVGGTKEPSPLCYPSPSGFNNHEEFGAAEAVTVTINNEKEFSQAADIFFNDFQRIGVKTWARRDVYDQGPQFRAVVGMPGGLKGSMGELLESSNKHNMTLLEGMGSGEAWRGGEGRIGWVWWLTNGGRGEGQGEEERVASSNFFYFCLFGGASPFSMSFCVMIQRAADTTSPNFPSHQPPPHQPPPYQPPPYQTTPTPHHPRP